MGRGLSDMSVALTLHGCIVLQTMNVLVVNQSVADMCASFFTLLIAIAEVDGTRMSRSSIYDQFVCRMWLTRSPLFSFLFTSTFNILLMTLERYVAVVHHVWYHNSVCTNCIIIITTCMFFDAFDVDIKIWINCSFSYIYYQ